MDSSQQSILSPPGHAHDHRSASRRSLSIALALIMVYMVVEVVGGGDERDLGEEVEMTVRMSGFAHRRLAENVGDVVVALVVRLLCEIEVAHVYLGGSGECLL